MNEALHLHLVVLAEGAAQPVEKEAREDLTVPCNCLKGGCSEAGTSLFAQVTSGFNFRLSMTSPFFTERVVMYFNRLPRMESQYMKALEKLVDMALEVMVQW